MTLRPITEDELHGFVDQTLDSRRHAEVETYLNEHPDVAERIARYSEQRTMLRDTLAPIADEPVPPQLNLAHMIAARRQPRHSARWMMAAAAVILLSIGGGAGWSLRGMGLSAKAPSSSPGIQSLVQDASASYAVYAPDMIRPVEVRADDRNTLASWTTQQLGRKVAIPDLAASGYRFMGGRVVPTEHGAAAMFMYDDDRGTRLVMLVRPMAADNNMPMVPHTSSGLNGFTWADNGLGYSLVGRVESEALHPIANDVRRQL